MTCASLPDIMLTDGPSSLSRLTAISDYGLECLRLCPMVILDGHTCLLLEAPAFAALTLLDAMTPPPLITPL